MAITRETLDTLARDRGRRPRWLQAAINFTRRRPLGTIGAIIIVVMAIVGLGAPWVAPFDPLTTDYGAMIAPPSLAHWLGTDAYGRDVLSRILYGSRTALIVGFGASILGATLGA